MASRRLLLLRAKKRRVDSDFAPLEFEVPHDEPEVSAPAPLPVQQGPWMGRRELDAAGFEDTVPSGHAELMEADGGRARAPAGSTAKSAPGDVEATIAGFREGCWVDLSAKRGWLRAQLVWASTKGTLFMFVSHGGQPHSMTKRSCERLIRERLLRPVDSQGVVAQALDAVASEVVAQATPATQAEPETA